MLNAARLYKNTLKQYPNDYSKARAEMKKSLLDNNKITDNEVASLVCSILEDILEGEGEVTDIQPINMNANQLEEIRAAQILYHAPRRNEMPFIGKEDLGFELFTKHIQQRKLNQQTTKEESTILAFSGAPGIGKTRCAIEGFDCMLSYLKNRKNSDKEDDVIARHLIESPCLFFVISFSNGTSLSIQEKMLKTEQGVIDIVLNRIIGVCSDPKYYNNPLPLNQFKTLSDLLQAIAYKPSSIYLVVDEYQKLLDITDIPCGSGHRNGLDVVCNVLGECISQMAIHNHLFIPIFVGLDQLSLTISLKKSTFPYQNIRTTRPRLFF